MTKSELIEKWNEEIDTHMGVAKLTKVKYIKQFHIGASLAISGCIRDLNQLNGEVRQAPPGVHYMSGGSVGERIHP